MIQQSPFIEQYLTPTLLNKPGPNEMPTERLQEFILDQIKSTYGAWTSQIEAVDEGTEEDWREHFKEMTATGMTAEIIAECSFANPNIWAFLASKPTMKSFDFAGHHHTIRDIDHRKGFLVRTTSDDKSVKQEWRNGPYIRSYRHTRANTVRLV